MIYILNVLGQQDFDFISNTQFSNAFFEEANFLNGNEFFEEAIF